MWLQQAEKIGDQVSFAQIFQYRRLKQLGAGALVLVLICGAFAVRQQTETGVFLQRLMGMDVEWPRRTHLALNIPGESPHYRVERDASGKLKQVLVAKSASLPVGSDRDGFCTE